MELVGLGYTGWFVYGIPIPSLQERSWLKLSIRFRRIRVYPPRMNEVKVTQQVMKLVRDIREFVAKGILDEFADVAFKDEKFNANSVCQICNFLYQTHDATNARTPANSTARPSRNKWRPSPSSSSSGCSLCITLQG